MPPSITKSFISPISLLHKIAELRDALKTLAMWNGQITTNRDKFVAAPPCANQLESMAGRIFSRLGAGGKGSFFVLRHADGAENIGVTGATAQVAAKVFANIVIRRIGNLIEHGFDG